MAHLPLIDAQEWESVSSKFNYNDIPVYWNGYKIGIRKMIEVIQQSFQSTGKYFVESFDVSQFKHNRKGVQYKDIHASKIIFCNGVSDMHTQWFKKLPFIKNRGDILILNIPELPVDDVYDLGVRLVHLHQQVWWCGANQQWSLKDMLPDTQWRDQVIERLTQQLNIDFKVEKHLVAQRPTTEGQFHLMGLHPQFTEIGLMNGMGSRGLTFAPVLAQRFAAYLCGATTKIESYNQSRFESFCV
jgi:glycine/D-amino acid oxidase-like deaminating enzyme